MPVIYTDSQIDELLREPKHLPQGWRTRLRLREKRGHDERDLEITGELGGEFRLILRRSRINRLDFSAILAVQVPHSSRLFRLRRYNGKSHEHTNRIEGDTFFDFHIHMATELYQAEGGREDGYAEVTARYGDFNGALSLLLDESGFIFPANDQMSLF